MFSPIHVRADPDRPHQILLNRMTSAIKFTEVGGTVTTFGEARDDTAQTHVCDKGVGIPAESQEHMFDPFVQTRKTTGPVFRKALASALPLEVT